MRKVIIIDDSAAVARLLARALEERGCDVLTFSKKTVEGTSKEVVAEAVRASVEFNAEVALCDLNWGAHSLNDGPEGWLYAEGMLKTGAKTGTILDRKIIIMSVVGSAEVPDYKEAALSHGADDFVRKDFDEVITTIFGSPAHSPD